MSKTTDRELLQSCFRRLTAELGDEAGAAAARIFIEELGGIQVYIPNVSQLEREERDADIRAAFRGDNHFELAALHHITTRQVRRIVNEG